VDAFGAGLVKGGLPFEESARSLQVRALAARCRSGRRTAGEPSAAVRAGSALAMDSASDTEDRWDELDADAAREHSRAAHDAINLQA